ncbi:hypothetical protein ACFYP4_04120 [Streptomyces sp. NPDC005551]|uniref:hypothetical protein n=1 Tax=unclassified Streptomyces TaxID=2593676 RepID=UPI0033CFAB96
MVLPVGVHALRKRRAELRASADAVSGRGDGASCGLLLFYAAECGLKERLLVRRGQRDTTALEPTHDLRALAKELNLPRAIDVVLNRLQSCRLGGPDAGTLALSELHQAWRYGARLHAEDEKKAQELLRGLIDWCENDARS